MRIPVFYLPEQNADVLESPSAAKPQHVVKSWLDAGFAIDVLPFKPLLHEQISRAHSVQYVHDVLNCVEANGFGTIDAAVSKSLPYTTGSFYRAAREALKNKKVACSPTSGFHHAEYQHGAGYCTFNGLMIAARGLQEMHGVKQVGILDCDEHYGNGTDDIIHQLRLKLHNNGQRVRNFTRPTPYPRPAGKEMRSRILKTLVEWKSFGTEIIFYQAGADQHLADGGPYDDEELHLRDLLVFRTCRDLEMPIVWNLAGGYQQDRSEPDFAKSIRKVLDIHDHTMQACIEVFGKES